VWGTRSGCEVVTGAPNSDPGAVAFTAIDRAIATDADVVVIDTAGRLHTQDQLMAELGKIRRVIAQRLDGAPHETLLTIDATTGQNGLRQAEIFSSVTPVDGIVLTKLDGTAKGGIAIAIADKLGIPVKLVGVGEAVEDLRPFDAADFASALLQ
jgi:fused signal recognition particle receptor